MQYGYHQVSMQLRQHKLYAPAKYESLLANWWDVLEVAEEGGHFDKPALEEVRKFLHDPISWSSHHGGKSA